MDQERGILNQPKLYSSQEQRHASLLWLLKPPTNIALTYYPNPFLALIALGLGYLQSQEQVKSQVNKLLGDTSSPPLIFHCLIMLAKHHTTFPLCFPFRFNLRDQERRMQAILQEWPATQSGLLLCRWLHTSRRQKNLYPGRSGSTMISGFALRFPKPPSRLRHSTLVEIHRIGVRLNPLGNVIFVVSLLWCISESELFSSHPGCFGYFSYKRQNGNTQLKEAKLYRLYEIPR